MSELIKAFLRIKKLALEDTNFTPYTIDELDYKDRLEKSNAEVEKDSKIVMDKLSQLEDIEDEFGFALQILPKLLQIKKHDKLYYNDGKRIIEVEVQNNTLQDGDLIVFALYVEKGIYYTPVLFYKDYGKTWALTKEGIKIMKEVLTSQK